MTGTRRDEYVPVAQEVPFDNENNDFQSDNVQDAIEEAGASVSSGFTWGKRGNLTSNEWLLNDDVSSNKSGRPVGTSSKVAQITVANEKVVSFTIGIYEHDGNSSNLSLLVSVTVSPAATTDDFDETDFGVVNLTKGKQLAVKVISGSPKNLIVNLQAKGAVVV